VIGGAVIVIAAIAGILLASGGGDTTTDAPSTTQAAIVVIGGSRPPAVVAETASLDSTGTALFSWVADQSKPGDVYRIERSDTGEISEGTSTSVEFKDAPSDLCITVTVMREGEQDSDPTRWCVEQS
jgi:hypothetical protein